MKVKGHLNMLGHMLQNVNLEAVEGWPVGDPGEGRLCFKKENGNFRLYISGGLENGVRVWVPMSQEMSMHIHDQPSAATTWTIDHKLNIAGCVLQVQNTSNEMLMFDAAEFLFNQATVKFSLPQAGRAILIATSLEGVERAVISYENAYTNQATWTINHGLGYQPIIRTYINGHEVQPLSVTHTDENTAVVSFSSPQTGTVKCI